jgi:hypothetical protein
MLTDTIMYDCIEYLLRDKNDEESLECLCRLLRTIGKELDGKASEKVIGFFFFFSKSSQLIILRLLINKIWKNIIEN